MKKLLLITVVIFLSTATMTQENNKGKTAAANKLPEDRIINHIEGLRKITQKYSNAPVEGLQKIRLYLDENLPDIMKSAAEVFVLMSTGDNDEKKIKRVVELNKRISALFKLFDKDIGVFENNIKKVQFEADNYYNNNFQMYEGHQYFIQTYFEILRDFIKRNEIKLGIDETKIVKQHALALKAFQSKVEIFKVLEIIKNSDIDKIIDIKPIDMTNEQYVTILNDYAFFLIETFRNKIDSDTRANLQLGKSLLEKLIQEYPTRKTLYNNLADAYVAESGLFYLNIIQELYKKHKELSDGKVNPFYEYIINIPEDRDVSKILIDMHTNGWIEKVELDSDYEDYSEEEGGEYYIKLFTKEIVNKIFHRVGGTLQIHTLSIDDGYIGGAEGPSKFSPVPFDNKLYLVEYSFENSNKIEAIHIVSDKNRAKELITFDHEFEITLKDKYKPKFKSMENMQENILNKNNLVVFDENSALAKKVQNIESEVYEKKLRDEGDPMMGYSAKSVAYEDINNDTKKEFFVEIIRNGKWSSNYLQIVDAKSGEVIKSEINKKLMECSTGDNFIEVYLYKDSTFILSLNSFTKTPTVLYQLVKNKITTICEFENKVIHIKNIQKEKAVEKRLQEISKLNLEYMKSEEILNKKINELKKTDPTFKEKSRFENDKDYTERLSLMNSKIDSIKKEINRELNIEDIKDYLFPTNNINIIIDPEKYNANNENWPMTIINNSYQKEQIDIILNIKKEEAASLWENWDKTVKKGFLSIDVRNQVGLSKIQIEDTVTGNIFEQEINLFKAFRHVALANEIALSPDGKLLAACDDYYAKIFDIETGKEIKYFIFGGSRINSIRFSPDGKLLAACDDYYAKIFDIETGKEIKYFKFDDSRINSIQFSPNGKTIAISSSRSYYDEDIEKIENMVRIFDIETGDQKKSFEQNVGVNTLAFSPDGKTIAIGSSVEDGEIIENMVRIFDIETGDEKRIFGYESEVTLIRYSLDGNYLATGTVDHKVQIFSIEEPEDIEVLSLTEESSVEQVAFSKDGRYLTTCGKNFANIYRTLLYSEVYEEESEGEENKAESEESESEENVVDDSNEEVSEENESEENNNLATVKKKYLITNTGAGQIIKGFR